MGAVFYFERRRKVMTSKLRLRAITEGAIFTAIALVLSYIEFPIGLAYGGSIDFVMIPIILFSIRWGLGWGLASGFVFGTLKYFLAAGFAINWESIILDYSVAYMAVGLAGLFRNRKWGLVTGGLLGCLGRFVVHFISGITIYAEYMPDEFLNMSMSNVWIYSALYNGLYMLPNTIVALIVGVVLTVPLAKYIQGRDMIGKTS
jgi:thiamine transporter